MACTAPKGEAFAPVNISAIRVTPSSGTVIVGQGLQLSAVPVDAAGNQLAGRTLVWTSSSTSVATISQGGSVQGVSPGLATISATSEGRVGYADITVTKVPVTAVSVQPNAMTLSVGQQYQLTALAKDANGIPLTDRVVTWLSDNQATATVTATGLVTAVGAGNAQINVVADGKASVANVSVTPPRKPVASVTVTPAIVSLQAGSSLALASSVADAQGQTLSDRSVSWQSSAPAIASVSSVGLVQAIAAGVARITATSDGVSGGADVTVGTAAKPVSAVRLSSATLTVLVGQFATLTATPLDASGAAVGQKTVLWSSNTPSIVSVNSAGLLSGLSAGTATVYATVDGVVGQAIIAVTAATTGPGVISTLELMPYGNGYLAGDSGSFVLRGRSSDGATVSFSPSVTGGFGPGSSSAVSICTNEGCRWKVTSVGTHPDGQLPRGYTGLQISPPSGTPTTTYFGFVFSNVADSIALKLPNPESNGTIPVPVGYTVSVGTAVYLFPYLYWTGDSWGSVANVEFTIAAGSASVDRCMFGFGSLLAQYNCAIVSPKSVGEVVVRARLKKSDGTYWTTQATIKVK